jgi:CHAD domain-containing protein
MPTPESPQTASSGIAPNKTGVALGRKRLEKFAALMSRVIVTDDADTIHDVRVWSRRLQQILGLVAPQSAKKTKSRKLARRLREARRILGRPRNIDVITQLVQERIDNANNPVVRDGWEQLQTYLAGRRLRAIERSREELRDFDLVNFAASARTLIDDAGDGLQALVTDGVTAALTDWRAAIEVAKTQPQPDELHALRIAGKRLRYRVELLAELDHAPAKSWVKALRSLQDQLGSWHDRQVLLETCAKFLSRKNFLVSHPGLARVLLLEMEREQRRASAAIDGLVKQAEKTARSLNDVKLSPDQTENTTSAAVVQPA